MLELTTFRLTDGADVDGFLAADAAVQTGFFCLQAGMLRRTTAKGEDGDWLALVLWAGAEQADAAATAGASSSEVAAFSAFVDGSSVRVQRFFPLAG